MGAYKYIRESMQKAYKERNEGYKKRLIAWRHGPAIERVEKPTNIARARTLGYKAKKGYVIVRTRVDKGRRRRRTPMGGRKARHNYLLTSPGWSHQAIAEQRANRKFQNLEVINSYWVGEDGTLKFFEVILGDPALLADEVPMLRSKRRAYRGLTSAGKKARAL